MKFATQARRVPLPKAAPTAAQTFSVPRPSGGYDYYQAPEGTTPPLGNDYPVPNVAHANPIGISSLHVGREMPPGCVRVGSGERAIGSITAMPGAGGSIPGLGSLGLEIVTGGSAGGGTTLIEKMGNMAQDRGDPLLRWGGLSLAAVLAFFGFRAWRRR